MIVPGTNNGGWVLQSVPHAPELGEVPAVILIVQEAEIFLFESGSILVEFELHRCE